MAAGAAAGAEGHRRREPDVEPTRPGSWTRLNYSGIDVISPVIVQDMEGKDVDVGHHTWVEGPCASCSNPQMIRPMAITGQYGCGRMMYQHV